MYILHFFSTSQCEVILALVKFLSLFKDFSESYNNFYILTKLQLAYDIEKGFYLLLGRYSCYVKLAGSSLYQFLSKSSLDDDDDEGCHMIKMQCRLYQVLTVSLTASCIIRAAPIQSFIAV